MALAQGRCLALVRGVSAVIVKRFHLFIDLPALFGRGVGPGSDWQAEHLLIPKRAKCPYTLLYACLYIFHASKDVLCKPISRMAVAQRHSGYGGAMVHRKTHLLRLTRSHVVLHV